MGGIIDQLDKQGRLYLLRLNRGRYGLEDLIKVASVGSEIKIPTDRAHWF